MGAVAARESNAGEIRYIVEPLNSAMRWLIDAICDLLYPREPDQPDVGIGWKLAVLALLAAIVAVAVIAR